MRSLLAVGDQLDVDAARAGLQEADFQVLRASSLAQGRRTFCRYRPAIAIVQQRLQDGHGIELVREIRALEPLCEVIFVASPGPPQDVADIMQSGASDYLPVAAAPGELSDAMRRAATRLDLPGTDPAPTLLLLEDHDQTRDLLTRILRKNGYRVLSAADGLEGMRMLETNGFDLIVTDVRLPGPTGIEVLREARRRGIDAAAVITTGNFEDQTVTDALRLGAVGYLRKPIDLDELLDTLHRALGQLRERRAAAGGRAANAPELVVRLTDKRELVLESASSSPTALLHHLTELVASFGYRAIVLDADQRVAYRDPQLSLCSLGEPVDSSVLSRCGVAVIDDDALARCVDDALSALSSSVEALAAGVLATAVTVRQGRCTRRLAIIAIPIRKEP